MILLQSFIWPFLALQLVFLCVPKLRQVCLNKVQTRETTSVLYELDPRFYKFTQFELSKRSSSIIIKPPNMYLQWHFDEFSFFQVVMNFTCAIYNFAKEHICSFFMKLAPVPVSIS